MRILAAIILTFISLPLIADDKNNWKVEKIVNEYETHPLYPKPYPVSSTITFKNGVKLEANIIEIEVIDVILSSEGIPFVIFSGVDCYDCHVNTAIYIHSPSSGFLDGSSGKNRYSYPGKLKYYLDNTLLHEQRLFYGNCLTKDQKNAVWYTNYVDKAGKWNKEVYAVEFTGTKRQELKKKLDYSNLDKTLSLVQSGMCKEVPGTEMISEP